MNDIITEIKEDKRRAEVVINGDESLWFSRAAFEERPLSIGASVDLEELQEWLLPRQYPDALSKAVAFLAVRARSMREIRQKLTSKGYMERTIDMVLYKLEKERLVDDEAFARDWAEARAKAQLGNIRILRELLQKGIDRELAERVLAERDIEENSEDIDKPIHRLALKLLKRVKNEPDSRKAMQKVMSAMARRGFSYSEASEAVQAALHELGDSSAPEMDFQE